MFRFILAGWFIRVDPRTMTIDHREGSVYLSAKPGTGTAGGGACNFWVVTLTADGETPKLKIAAGTVGGCIPSNFAELFDVEIAETGDEQIPVYFVVDCTMENGSVASCVLRAVQSTDAEDIAALIPAQEGSPPDEISIVVARWMPGRTCGFTRHINVVPANTWDAAVTDPDPGSAAWVKWWSYAISEA
jgi:hypothetical protein